MNDRISQDQLLPFPSTYNNRLEVEGYTMVPTWLLIWLVIIITLMIIGILWKLLSSEKT